MDWLQSLPVEEGATAAIPGVGWASMGAQVAGQMLSKPPAGPSSADSTFGTNLTFDNSGWSVNFAPNGTASNSLQKPVNQGGPAVSPLAGMDWKTVLIVGLGLGVIWKLARK